MQVQQRKSAGSAPAPQLYQEKAQEKEFLALLAGVAAVSHPLSDAKPPSGGGVATQLGPAGSAAAAGSVGRVRSFRAAAPDTEIFPAELLQAAVEADESGSRTTAVVLYKQGVDALLGLAEAGGTDELSVESLRGKARLYMDRAKVRGGSGSGS